ncbi:MAG: hypothetical protein MJ108_08060 [Saccharofermentans sp.]|nr:hypothetical protein [Saccharofermentans sp.]
MMIGFTITNFCGIMIIIITAITMIAMTIGITIVMTMIFTTMIVITIISGSAVVFADDNDFYEMKYIN